MSVAVKYLTCAACKRELPEDAFHVSRRGSRGRGSRCRECERARVAKYTRDPLKARASSRRHYAKNEDEGRARNRRYQAENGDKVYFRKIRQKFGVSREEYERMLQEQGGVCRACRQPSMKQGESVRLAVDHCHETGTVRGLLCFNCNTVLGKVHDDPALLRLLAAYLERSIEC